MTFLSRSSRTDGLAIFATAAFCLGLAAVAVLARVGAPDGLVRAMGPIITLAGSVIVGLGAYNAELAAFLAARRALRPFAGALNIAAVGTGIVFCLDPSLALASDPAWFGVAAGLPIAAIGFQPLLRSFGATSAADVVATRFAMSPAHAVAALSIWATAALTALAGYRTAVAAVEALVTSEGGRAEALVAAALALSVVPGGLVGVVWCGAASAVAVMAVVALGRGMSWPSEIMPVPPHVAAADTPDLASLGGLASFIAAPLALGFFFAFEPSASASRDARDAVKAGFGGAILCLALAVATISSASPFRVALIADAADEVRASLIGAAVVAAMLALARVAVHTSSRALGTPLAAPPKPSRALASVRLARMRAAQLLLVIACPACARIEFLDPRTALLIALALSLATTAPLVALALIKRVGSVAASGAVVAGAAVALLRAPALARFPVGAVVLKEALFVAAAVFAAGLLISLFAPRRGPAPTSGKFDPFAEVSAQGTSSRRASS